MSSRLRRPVFSLGRFIISPISLLASSAAIPTISFVRLVVEQPIMSSTVGDFVGGVDGMSVANWATSSAAVSSSVNAPSTSFTS